MSKRDANYQFISLSHICQVLGITKGCAYKQIHDGSFAVPVFRVGNLWRCLPEDWEAYLDGLRKGGKR